MKKRSKEIPLLCIHTFRDPKEAERYRKMLLKAGTKAGLDQSVFGKRRYPVTVHERTPVWIEPKDSKKAGKILSKYAKEAEKRGVITLPPEENTLAFLDMLIHDCRQYLMIATGELKSIEEEGTLELDDPSVDIEKITIRLKRLKSQCMRMASRTPLDWER